MSACRVSANLMRSAMKSSASFIPRLRPSLQVSVIAACSVARSSGSARITPSGWRDSAVVPDMPTRKTNFCHRVSSMSSTCSILMPAAFAAATNAAAPGPTCSACIVPVCVTTPGELMLVAM